MSDTILTAFLGTKSVATPEQVGAEVARFMTRNECRASIAHSGITIEVDYGIADTATIVSNSILWATHLGRNYISIAQGIDGVSIKFSNSWDGNGSDGVVMTTESLDQSVQNATDGVAL